MPLQKPPLLVIAGPTASGKTSLSIALSHKLNGEVVAMDSMQIYKYMDIGTAKPTQVEREGIAHHMLDVADPKDPYTVADYVAQAKVCIQNILNKGKLPILTGGTGLYLKALTTTMDLGGVQSDPGIRQRLTALSQEDGGIDSLIAMLIKVDPITAGRLHRNDLRRIIRALEVYEITGRPFSMQQKDNLTECPYSLCILGMMMDREVLYHRIEQRVDEMMQLGLYQEVERLISLGVPPEAQAMQGLGYKELLPVFYEKKPIHQAVDDIKLGTRHYAKRQMTWFRRTEGIHWLNATGNDLMKASLYQINNDLNI